MWKFYRENDWFLDEYKFNDSRFIFQQNKVIIYTGVRCSDTTDLIESFTIFNICEIFDYSDIYEIVP